ncbi:MAG: S8/S53 family peptidase [Candidatus Promineifilaceae bacterium]
MSHRKRYRALLVLLPAMVALLALLAYAHGSRLAAAQPGDVLLPAVFGRSADYRHPLLALAEMDGPLPLFDILNDAQGRRYVIGEGAGAGDEDSPMLLESGLFTAERRPMQPGEFDKKVEPVERPVTPTISEALRRLIANRPPDDQVQVMVSFEENLMPLQTGLERAIAEGQVRSDYEEGQMLNRLRAEQQRELALLRRPFVNEILTGGGSIDYACANAPCIAATMHITDVLQYAQRAPGVVWLDVLPQALPNAQESPIFQSPPVIITGVTVRHGLQIKQFIDQTYDGNGASDQSEADNIVIAVVESGSGYDDDHAGFRESGPASSFRYATGGGSTGKWACTNMGCQAVNSFASPGSHATGAAGLALGDLEQGQIPGVPAAVRPTVSGYAREAVAHLYAFSGGAVQTLDHIGGLTAAQGVPDIVTNSWGYIESPDCYGGSDTARAANRLYEDGIAVLAAAHNLGGSPSDCNVTAPGSAIGVFTVGAHLWGYEGDPNTVRTAPIYDNMDGNSSSWGGHATAGQNRSIVDITANGTRANKFNTSGSYSQTGVICCTSAATPQVAGAAADFMDFYEQEYSNFIDNPGSLYANLLLMGDRQGVNGKINSRLDHRWGAGRLRMRMFNSAGMDPPWYYFNGYSCISDGEIWDFPIGDGGHLSQDIDVIKAAAYWYDTRHDGSLGSGAGSVADVDLHIVNVPTGQPVVTDSDSYDNKARVFYQDAGGLQLSLRLLGYDVSGHDDPVCGSDAILVYFAYFVEDSDREAPVYNPITGTGIFPEGS